MMPCEVFGWNTIDSTGKPVRADAAPRTRASCSRNTSTLACLARWSTWVSAKLSSAAGVDSGPNRA
jgi:hypothetical protein